MQLGIRSKRALEIVLEIGIGLLVVAICYFFAIKAPNAEFPAKWVGLGISTLVLFGYPVYWARSDLANWKFWGYWIAFLSFHLGIFISLLTIMIRWPLMLFVLTTLGEFAFIGPILGKIRHYPLQREQ